MEAAGLYEGGRIGSVHERDNGHKFEGQAATSVGAGSPQAGDRRGIVRARDFGIDRGAALRGQHQAGFKSQFVAAVLQFWAWFKKCHFQVTPEIDRALMVKGFLVLGVTLI